MSDLQNCYSDEDLSTDVSFHPPFFAPLKRHKLTRAGVD